MRRRWATMVGVMTASQSSSYATVGQRRSLPPVVSYKDVVPTKRELVAGRVSAQVGDILRQRRAAEPPKPPAVELLVKVFRLEQGNRKLARSSFPLYRAIASHVKSPDLYTLAGMNEAEDSNWFAMNVLHLWMVLVRLRKEGKAGAFLSQEIFDRFWEEVESRILAKENNPFLLSRYEKQQFKKYHGALIAYDAAAMARSDSTMAESLYRNLISLGDGVGAQGLRDVVQHVYKSLLVLDCHSMEDFSNGVVVFPSLDGL